MSTEIFGDYAVVRHIRFEKSTRIRSNIRYIDKIISDYDQDQDQSSRQ